MMEYRRLGRTDMTVSAVSFGAWGIGGSWGPVDDEVSMRALHAAVDAGVNFIDTADVYGDGRSERLIARLRCERPRDTIWVATKAGRRLSQQTPEGYTRDTLTCWVEDSLHNLKMDAVDLLQLHCPPLAVYHRADVFDVLEGLVRAGKIRYYGVSVETCEEALAALAHSNVQTIQIIFNLFRHKPAEVVLPAARARGVGILARVPLASGLLGGGMSRESVFAPDDHRTFNREGQAFDPGETFSGVPYEVGLEVVERVRALVPAGATLPQFALRWTLMFEAVTCAIPGVRTERQARENTAAASLPPLAPEAMQSIAELYDRRVRPLVHARW